MRLNEVSLFTSLWSVDAFSPKSIRSRRENNTSRMSGWFLLTKCFQFVSDVTESGPNTQLSTASVSEVKQVRVCVSETRLLGNNSSTTKAFLAETKENVKGNISYSVQNVSKQNAVH